MEWAQTVLETESHNLPSASRKTNKASGVIHPESKGVKTGVPVSKDRVNWMSQLKHRVNSPVFHFFVLFRPSIDWMVFIGEGSLLSLVYQLKY